ncbi:hypothetical protein MMC31_002556 [Peltigera leucophlebia]|nr:hypothetical protein [Peltigera leucophlebia]
MASWGSEEDRAASAQHLKILLDMSQKLELEEELTPIMAWSYISKHERFTELTYTDFELLGEELIAKTRCFGFGAALELLEVQDALNRIFAMKAPKR